MLVRRGRPGDAAAVAAVHVRTWQGAYAHVFGADRLATLDLPARTKRWEGWLASGERVLVAEDDGRVVGFAWFGEGREDGDAAELYAIYVLPEAWGGGAGPALMRATLAELREDGRGEAFLWVLEDNPRARRFYEREGWSADGGRKEEEFLGVRAAEVRYRIRLRDA